MENSEPESEELDAVKLQFSNRISSSKSMPIRPIEPWCESTALLLTTNDDRLLSIKAPSLRRKRVPTMFSADDSSKHSIHRVVPTLSLNVTLSTETTLCRVSSIESMLAVHTESVISMIPK